MFYEVNGTSYWVEESGEGEPIVFLHGFTSSSKTWETVLPYIRDDYRKIVVDLPGHGCTTSHNGMPDTMEALCEELAQLLQQLGVDRTSLVGYSMGGRTALSFAVTHPELVDKLVLASASPGLDSTEEQLARQAKDETLAQFIEKEGIEAFVSYWENIPLFRTQKQLPPDVREKVRKERIDQSAAGLAASLRSVGTGVQPSWWSKLGELELPTCLIVGELDDKFVRINKRMLDELKQAEMHVVPGVGHAVHVETPRVFAEHVNKFMVQ
ncbi:2-succinyl-6-hydroxy-2,4-cyclohexadiene-1-carboxylate synthase [Thalassobacillus hwangdonensis]|uniref:Putative 2-succinyl-6-hydroxy-2,4-cyclohexadiene-1-carboxylate synthase n=1 Tax=Thalassobacillus hwangdonensis TaxID=546108 RepID=A0ABW3L681_9BACI